MGVCTGALDVRDRITEADRRLVAGAGEQAPAQSQLTLMALTMRPAGLSSAIDKDRADYTVFCGEWNSGRICDVRGGPDHLRWFWALHFPSKPRPPNLQKAPAGALPRPALP